MCKIYFYQPKSSTFTAFIAFTLTFLKNNKNSWNFYAKWWNFLQFEIEKFTVRKFHPKNFCLKPGYLLNSKSRFLQKFTIRKFFTISKFTIRKFDCTNTLSEEINHWKSKSRKKSLKIKEWKDNNWHSRTLKGIQGL